MSRRFIYTCCLFTILGVAFFQGSLEASTTGYDATGGSAPLSSEASFRLVGTAVTDDPSDRLAVIAVGKSGRQKSFREGARIGQYLIKEILRDRIIIDSGEGEKVVKLQRALSSGIRLPQETKPAHGKASAGTRTPGRHRFLTLSRDRVESGLSDLDQKLNDVDISSGMLFNRPVGFRITSFESDSIFSELGLKNGDLILGINNQEIPSAERADYFFQTILEGGDVDVKLRRRARTYHINISIQ
jgi:general secretion pathway protein C